MKKTILFLFLFCSFGLHAQVEPQFKFYLAFEDAKHEKDTVWMVIDSNASEGLSDTLLGESNELLDSAKFQVWLITNLDDSVLKTLSFPIRVVHSYSIFIKSKNAELPIIMSWDTNLLKEHDLPFELLRVWAQSNYFSENSIGTLNLFENDSSILAPFTAGGGSGEHFPLTVKISDNLGNVGLNEMHDLEVNIYPNPCNQLLNVEMKNFLNSTFNIYDFRGQKLRTGIFTQTKMQIDLSNFKSGCYLLSINRHNLNYYEKFIVLD